MRKLKLLFVLLSVVFVSNRIVAQNDSIYEGTLSIVDNICDISFYSTYDIDSIDEIHLSFYDKITDEYIGNAFMSYYRPLNIFISKFGEVSIENVSDDINIIHINNAELYSYLKDKSLKIELYITGEGYTSNKLKALGNSNILTLYYDHVITSIKEINIAEENSYKKYYLLTGQEVDKQPYNTPFVEVVYVNDEIVSREIKFVLE